MTDTVDFSCPWQYLAHWAHQTPNAEAVIQGEMRLSYAQLARRVEAIAVAMAAAGIKPGDRVATLSGPSIAFVETFLGANRLGAIWLGLNPKYQSRELVQVLRDAGPSLVFFEPGSAAIDDTTAMQAVVHEAGLDDCQLVALTRTGGAPALDVWIDAHPVRAVPAEADASDGEQAAVLVYTSGSTGVPKGAMLSGAAINRFARRQNVLWPLSPHRVLNYFPINHIGSLVDMFAPCLVAGGAMVLMEQFDPLQALQCIEREKLTLWGSVPSVFMLQLALPQIHEIDLSSLQLIVWEGAAMPVEVARALRDICPRLATNYGMTETTSAITALPPTDDVALLTQTVGRPFPGVSVRLCDEEGCVVPPGQVGEVYTRSDQLTLGYWRNPAATEAAFTQQGWFRTGDIAIWRSDGNLCIVGRVKEMYKSGGYNVYPREIEAVLEELDGVSAAAVVSVEDALWQEVGVAFVCAPQGQVATQVLEQHCRARLANYKVPKHFRVEVSLPLLPIGKIDKVSLKAQAGRLFGQDEVGGHSE
ncbi:class I adenylate-forming enzyme family protein [Parahaliea mediterranea]|uniref:class I adenylate-forming enzyme family protein n=1 Tax=Parahaliea mediterranea TaxID=651086 RepID=UPI0013003658|nr:class I adenylate-forming enzyme family protein [Parahaliea mediterranea]